MNTQIFTISDYLAWRDTQLRCGTGQPLDTPRGHCQVYDKVIIQDTVRPDWHMKNREIEDAEFRLLFYGTDMQPGMRERLYSNDDDLYNAYKSLRLVTLGTNGKRRNSRKNIIYRNECCLCYWQLHGDTLIVISRSWDLQRAAKLVTFLK